MLLSGSHLVSREEGQWWKAERERDERDGCYTGVQGSIHYVECAGWVFGLVSVYHLYPCYIDPVFHG